MRRRLAVASVAALAITGLAACGSDSPEEQDSAETDTASLSGDPIEGLEVTGEFGEEPKVAVDGLDVTELQSSLVIEGDGDAVPADGTVLIKSLFATGAEGKTLSSSFTEESPQRVVLAQTQDYFKEALTDAKVGSRVALALPAKEYFNNEEPPEGSGVTAEDDIIIVLDVVDLADPPLDGPEGEEVDPPADAPTVETEDGDVTGVDFSDAPEKAPTKLQVIPLIEGEGAEVKENDAVTVDYYGVVWGGDKAFDESFSREPANFTLAQGQLIDGWVEGLQGVTVGSRVMVVVPPAQGYGDKAQGNIPANSTLVFVVDVLGAGS